MENNHSELLLLSENIEAFNVFFNLRTQWQFAGMGSPTGLNYSSISFVMDMLNVKNRKDCFLRLRILESKALECFKKESTSGQTT